MRVIDILDQLSSIYKQPTPAALEAKNNVFRSPTSAANAPEILFCRIKECTEKALLGQNPYTNKHLITNMIRLLLTTGLYIRAFEDWDQLAKPAKTWIKLCRMIQEVLQCRLNATAPTARHQGYAPTLPFQKNVFGALTAHDSDDDSADTVATQMAFLTYQSQLTATTATNLSQQMGQYFQTLAHQQEQLYQPQYQMMEQMTALLFNQSNNGRSIGRQGCGPPPPMAPFAQNGFGCNTYGGRSGQDYGGHRGQGRGCGRGRGCGPPAFIAGRAPPIMPLTAGRAPGYMGLPLASCHIKRFEWLNDNESPVGILLVCSKTATQLCIRHEGKRIK
jgi:hypothetical protein